MKIDEIDDELLRLLNERTKLVAELGLIKKRHAIAGPLDGDTVSRIFQSIISESCRIQTSAREVEAVVLKRNCAR